MKFLIIAFAFVLLVACSQDRVNLVEHQRERDFYTQFVNNGKALQNAQSEIASLKILKISGLYEGRFALYENNTFYYEINNLGNGTGNWTFENGAMKLKAGRMFFDLVFTVSGAHAEGNATVVRFIDRNGAQKMDIQYQNMNDCTQDCVLPEFHESGKGL